MFRHPGNRKAFGSPPDVDEREWAPDCEGSGFRRASDGEGDIEQQLCGTIPFGEDTPAMSEPKPSFCSVSASSLPVVSKPFADWNRCTRIDGIGIHLSVGIALVIAASRERRLNIVNAVRRGSHLGRLAMRRSALLLRGFFLLDAEMRLEEVDCGVSAAVLAAKRRCAPAVPGLDSACVTPEPC